jgi:uncharacterized membrane protein YhaH (DUF805 family)
MIESFLTSEGRLGRFSFILRLAILAAIVYVVWLGSSYFFDEGMKVFYKDWHEGVFGPLAVFSTIVAALLACFIGLMQLLKRLRDMGKGAYLTLLMLIPGVNVLFLLYSAVAPSKAE